MRHSEDISSIINYIMIIGTKVREGGGSTVPPPSRIPLTHCGGMYHFTKCEHVHEHTKS